MAILRTLPVEIVAAALRSLGIDPAVVVFGSVRVVGSSLWWDEFTFGPDGQPATRSDGVLLRTEYYRALSSAQLECLRGRLPTFQGEPCAEAMRTLRRPR